MFDVTMAALEKALELRMRKHEVHTSNIANANVPEFKAKKIDFDARMREAMEALDRGDGTMISRENDVTEKVREVSAEIIEDPLLPMSGDGNTVNMEREQTELAKNQIGYQTAVQLMNKKFAMQKYVLGGGG
jgi:flagellar basal-body rod protein FlgB